MKNTLMIGFMLGLLAAGTAEAIEFRQGPAHADTICPCQLRTMAYETVLDDGTTTTGTPQATEKSPSSALTRSLIGTLAPLPTIVFAVPGIIFGPSLGYFYGDMPGRAWRGIGIRFVGVGGIVSSFLICGWDCGRNDSAYDLAWAVFLASSGLTIGSVIWDLASVKSAVREHNERRRKESSLSITPRYFSDSRTFGLGVTLRL